MGYCLSFVCWSILFYYFLESCYWIFSRYRFYSLEVHRNDWWIWGVVSFLVFVAVYSFFLLVFYPGVLTYDSIMQMNQVTGGNKYSNHHPWLHTIIIKNIYEFGLNLFKSSNKAVALYGLFSIGILSSSFAVAISYLRKKGLQSFILILLIGTYLLSPINQMYSITMWKDIPFAAIIVLFTILLCIMCDNVKNKKSNTLCYVLFVPTAFFVCFFRSNGLYVFYGMIPFLLWAFWKQRIKMLIAISTVIILGSIYKGPIFNYYNISEPDLIESLSIPAQQIAAVVAYDGNITEEQKALLSSVVDYDQIAEIYLSSPGRSDNLKTLVRKTNNQIYIKDHVNEFFSLYLELFKANKRIYIKAFIDETNGYWYHQVNSPYLWMTYIEDNGIGIERDNKFSDQVEVIVRKYLAISKALWDEFYSVGMVIYIFFVSLFIVLQKKSKYLIAYLPCLGVWGTVLLATPVNTDMRYVYAIYIAAPFLVGLSLLKYKQE